MALSSRGKSLKESKLRNLPSRGCVLQKTLRQEVLHPNCYVAAKFVTDQFFPLSPITIPEVFAKVKSAQFLARV